MDQGESMHVQTAGCKTLVNLKKFHLKRHPCEIRAFPDIMHAQPFYFLTCKCFVAEN